MNHGKYIVLNERNLIAFDATLSHSKIAEPFGLDNITSAGFISTFVDANNEIVVSCYGKSVTLGISSNSDDSRLARYSLGVDW